MFEVLVWRIFCIWLENILISEILYFWKLLVYSGPTVNDVYFSKFLKLLSWRQILKCILDVM